VISTPREYPLLNLFQQRRDDELEEFVRAHMKACGMAPPLSRPSRELSTRDAGVIAFLGLARLLKTSALFAPMGTDVSDPRWQANVVAAVADQYDPIAGHLPPCGKNITGVLDEALVKAGVNGEGEIFVSYAHAGFPVVTFCENPHAILHHAVRGLGGVRDETPLTMRERITRSMIDFVSEYADVNS
jgi:hypothetical protein